MYYIGDNLLLRKSIGLFKVKLHVKFACSYNLVKVVRVNLGQAYPRSKIPLMNFYYLKVESVWFKIYLCFPTCVMSMRVLPAQFS